MRTVTGAKELFRCLPLSAREEFSLNCAMRLSWLLLLVWVPFAHGQNGDKAGEVQAPPPGIKAPPAPPLSVEEALKSFRMQPGFQVEVVASEPLIEAPVEIEFDPDGRLYVLEMRDFMPNVDGRGEDRRTGRVSVLEDTNGDGRMDKSTVFVDGLLMPRAIAVTRGGLLVAEPPHLWFFKDTNGDRKADEKEEVSNDYGSQANPEHNANGLLWARDNWIYSANHTLRYRNIGGYWEKGPTQFRGQWGITQDDYGRLFFNSNSDQFRGDLVPGNYLLRNPNLKTTFGANVQIARDQATYPVRVNPGVNRGYQKGTLRADGTLAQFTAACGPCIYRGDLLPPEYYGAAFLCEPSANLVRCNFLHENEGVISAANAFPNAEFLASTDERFRPVNIANGPDGGLYIVDLYRGVIQHRIYLTTYLRNQSLERELEAPLKNGRIYRVTAARADPAKRKPAPKLNALSPADLVGQLGSTNGWVRDAAQQLLVEKRDFQSYEPLQELAARGEYPSAIHALWVLNALGEINSDTMLKAFNSPHAKVRATAVRVGEAFLRAEGKNEIGQKIIALAADPDTDVRLQVAFSLGESKSPEAEQALQNLLERNAEHPLIRAAVLSGLAGRELKFLTALRGQQWDEKTPGREEIVRSLAHCVAESRDSKAVAQLLDFAAGTERKWQQYAMLDGINAMLPKGKGKNVAPIKPVRLTSEPPTLGAFLKSADAGLKQRAESLDTLFVWPGKPGYHEAAVTPLTDAEKKRFEAGKSMYPVICGACHQPTGIGLEGLAPPLVDSEWAVGSAERLVRIVLKGIRGPINVKGRKWELEMPSLTVLPDEDIANLLTYIRREWGHSASPISPELVGKIRQEISKREEAWTEAELLRIQ